MNAILKRIPHDFPLSEQPYKEMGEKMGLREEEVIGHLRRLESEKKVRRVAAVLYHRKTLYTHNAMVVWKVAEEEVERVGKIMAAFPEVSHCYERDGGGFWEYTVYTMIHGRSQDECMDIVKRISEETDIKDFKVFPSKREFKKTSLSIEDDEE